MPELTSFAAIVLAGGRAARMGGADKASIELRGRTLLERALDAVVDASEVVVVGEQVPTERPVTWVVEEPRYGGPAAGLLTGREMLLRQFPRIAVIAVDMAMLTMSTVGRLHAAAVGRDGAVLVGPDGRRQLAFVVATERLDAIAPGLEERHGLPMWRLLEQLDLLEVPAIADEARDIDSWDDLRDLAGDS